MMMSAEEWQTYEDNEDESEMIKRPESHYEKQSSTVRNQSVSKIMQVVTVTMCIAKHGKQITNDHYIN